MREDRLLEPAELLARLEPELVPEPPPSAAVDVERLGLPPGAVEREHQLGPRPLAVRALLDERRELRDELLVAAEREPGLGALLARREPELGEPVGLGRANA